MFSRSASRSRPTRRRRPILAGLAMCVGLALPAASQDADGAEVLSAALTREALAVLAEAGVADPAGGGDGAPAAAEQAAAVLMDLSAELTPAAAEMQWLRAGLAERQGDTPTLREALSAYLRERPDDDAALLKAALVRVSEEQTLDGRLERMRQILERAERTGGGSPAMRSRLALLASEAAAEVGDAAQSLSLLATAAGLDPANAPAAAAVYGRLADAGADAKRLGAAASNWVYAAPVDPSPRLALARVLAGEGVYDAAAEQYERAELFSGGALLPVEDTARRAASLAAVGRSAEAVRVLDQAVERLGGEAETEPLLPLELLRVALAEPGAEARAMDRLLERLDARVENGGAIERLEARLDRAWVQAALAVRPVEEAERALEQVGGRYADDDPRRELAAGWIALRREDPETAAKAFAGAGDLPLAAIGLARTLDPGNPERLRLHRRLASTGGSGSPLAAVLAVRALEEANARYEPSAVGRTILDLMSRRPSSLWRMDVAREPLLDLAASVEPVRIEPFLPATLNLTLTNRSRIPVSLGNDQTLRPVVFANVALFEGEAAIGSLPTQVFNVGRRLTLGPGESLTVPARLDHGPIGQRLAEEPAASFRFGVSITLDPRLAPNGSVAIGPVGAVATLRSVQAGGEPTTEENVRGWLDAMSGESAVEEYVALARLSILQSGDDAAAGIGPRLLSDTSELLAERAPRLDRIPLALAGLYLRAEPRSGNVAERVLAVARSSDDDLVRVAALLGQVRDPSDPSLDAAVRAGSPRLRRFAEAWTRVLEARDPMSRRSALDAAPVRPAFIPAPAPEATPPG